jgi:hypothetical protein
MKPCTRCHKTKPLEDFPKDKNSEDGRKLYCSECINAMNRASHHRRKCGAAKQNENTKSLTGKRITKCKHPKPSYLTGKLCFDCIKENQRLEYEQNKKYIWGAKLTIPSGCISFQR